MRDMSELRVDIFRAGVPLYRLAGPAGMNPGRLGAMLSGKIPMPAEIAERVQAALERELAAAGQREPVEA